MLITTRVTTNGPSKVFEGNYYISTSTIKKVRTSQKYYTRVVKYILVLVGSTYKVDAGGEDGQESDNSVSSGAAPAAVDD